MGTKKLKKRSEIEQRFKWQLEDIYSSDKAWEEEYCYILDNLPKFEQYRTNLSTNNLINCLTLKSELSQKLGSIYAYANMRHHEDSAQAFYQGLADKAEGLASKLGAATSFIEPALLSMSDSEISGFLRDNAVYTHYIDELRRIREHILSPEMEELLASAGEIAGGPENIFAMINNADIKFGTIIDENGDETEVTHGRFLSFLESKNREVRKAAFESVYSAYLKQKNTIAAIYNSSVKTDLFFARARKYPSAIAAALSGSNIPQDVYESLIKTVNSKLHLMHRYIRLRKKMLGLDELHIYDLYTPLVADTDIKISYDEARETVYKSLEPMGEGYRQILAKGFENSWIDIYENEGKRSGAYSWGAYGAHPYVLLNYDNKINDMFTLAHEMGHALHSYFTWEKQPYIYGGYTIFLAEVASTVNEALLMEYLLKNTKDKSTKAHLINHFLEQFRGTMFRQTMFAEFEMKAHSMAENDEPLTVESLNGIYRDILVKYYGPDIVLDEQINMEWARIPHFYNAFYVYQYATGFSAAMALSNKILTEGQPAVDKYIKFLSGGSSEYSIDLLKKAGVDMASAEPIENALSIFENLLEQMENL